MNSVYLTSYSPAETLTRRQLLFFLVPFLTVLIIPLRAWIEINIWAIPILGLLALALMLAVIGLIKSLPRWALPSLGLAISLANLLLFQGLVYATPGLSQLKFYLWTDFIPGRVLYALIVAILSMVPTLLLLVFLTFLSSQLPALSAFRQNLGRDWTLLPFLLYTTNLLDPFYADPYRGLEPYQLLFTLILVGGAWYYLWTPRPRNRLAALLVTALLSGLVLALGIYQLYPLQTWANDVVHDFPRWWEAMLPLLDAMVMLTGICLMAAFGISLHQGRPAEVVGA